MPARADGETEGLDQALERLSHDAALRERADAELRAAASQEPLIAESLRTPQSPPYHAEGPAMDAHLRAILVALYALQAGKLRLLGLEEFRRMKGYEGEVEELQETLLEHLALFECFAICHDAGKWATLSFTSLPGSAGERLGFDMGGTAHWHEVGHSDRAKLRERYLALYAEFARDRAHQGERATQRAFFDAYGIECHYHGHERMVHAPPYRALLRRVSVAHRLGDREEALLAELIANHMAPLGDFARSADPARVASLRHLARSRGFDADDFVDMIQAALFLDGVCGSARLAPHGGPWHDPTPLTNFLRAEHDFAPWAREENGKRRAAERKSEVNRRFRTAGLDGVALMGLLKVEPGPKFGKALALVHAAVLGEAPWPAMPAETRRELDARAARFYAMEFEKAEDSE